MGRNHLIKGPLRIRTLEGSPISIGDTVLIPEVNLITLSQRRGSVTRRGLSGWGWAWVLLIPKAVIEYRADRSDGRDRGQRIPIPDRTGQALMVMTAVGLVVAMLCVSVQMITRSHRSSQSTT